MDPLLSALITLVVLSMIIERALAVVFDMEKLRPMWDKFDLKPLVAIAASLLVCSMMQFDLVRVLTNTCGEGCDLVADGTAAATWFGIAVTGFVVAGGSAGAVKLFQDVLGFRRSTREQLKALAEVEQQASKAEAEARLEKAEAEKSLAAVQGRLASTLSVPVPSAFSTTNILSEMVTEKEIEEGYLQALQRQP